MPSMRPRSPITIPHTIYYRPCYTHIYIYIHIYHRSLYRSPITFGPPPQMSSGWSHLVVPPGGNAPGAASPGQQRDIWGWLSKLWSFFVGAVYLVALWSLLHGIWEYMGGCQNYGPLLVPLNTRCRILRKQRSSCAALQLCGLMSALLTATSAAFRNPEN